MSAAKPPAPQTRPLPMFSLAGRVDPLELIRIVADETGATGIGAVLTYNEGSAEPRR